jgi:hypothetical protein
VSLFSIEPDLAFPRSTMAGLGQYALFEILHPSPKGYLALSLTRTYSGDGDSRLPRGEALGTAVNPIVFIGRGSARVFVPVQPRQIAGRFYFALDMLSPPIRFAAHRSGMMALYGRDVQFDPRRLSGFAREISYISSEEFAATIPPRSLSDFPKDLANPALEYSGIYEDGWVAEDSSFRLMQGGSKALRIAGSIPASWKSAGNRVRLLEDGAEIASQPLTGGSFELTTDVASQPGPHQIRIQFASVSKLGPLDPRPAAAHLSYLGFGPFAKADDIADSDRISFSSGWYDFERYRGQAFRWARSRASMHLNPERTERWLVADLEPNSGGRPATVIVVDGEGKVLFQQQLAGRREIKVPIGTAADLEIRIEGGLVKPSAADPRELAFRVFRLRLE